MLRTTNANWVLNCQWRPGFPVAGQRSQAHAPNPSPFCLQSMVFRSVAGFCRCKSFQPRNFEASCWKFCTEKQVRIVCDSKQNAWIWCAVDRESRPHCALRCHKKILVKYHAGIFWKLFSNLAMSNGDFLRSINGSQLTKLANAHAVGTYYNCSCRIQGFGSRSFCFSSLRAIIRTGLICHEYQRPVWRPVSGCVPEPLALASCLPRPPSHVLKRNRANC